MFSLSSFQAGMSTSLDTLCGQAFGAKQYYLLGIYKQRAILVLTPVSVVVAVIWAYTGQILLFFGQDPEIAMGAGSYIWWMIPTLFVYGPLQCHVRFLQTQNIVLPVRDAQLRCHSTEPYVGVLVTGLQAWSGQQGCCLGQHNLIPDQPVNLGSLHQDLSIM
jgi:hypothetical protein